MTVVVAVGRMVYCSCGARASAHSVLHSRKRRNRLETVVVDWELGELQETIQSGLFVFSLASVKPRIRLHAYHGWIWLYESGFGIMCHRRFESSTRVGGGLEER